MTSCAFVDWQSDPEWEDGWPSVVSVAFCAALPAMKRCS